MRRVIDRVASRANRAYDIGIAIHIQCLAQAADMYVDRPRFDIDIVAPNRVEQLLA